MNICISRKSSWLPLAGCRVSARVRGVGSSLTPSQKAFDSHRHSFHSQTCDPSLIRPQGDAISSHSMLQSRSCTIVPASPPRWETLVEERFLRQHIRVQSPNLWSGWLYGRNTAVDSDSFYLISSMTPPCPRITSALPRSLQTGKTLKI